MVADAAGMMSAALMCEESACWSFLRDLRIRLRLQLCPCSRAVAVVVYVRSGARWCAIFNSHKHAISNSEISDEEKKKVTIS